jgi:type IV pilus assembly protein PilM
MKSNTFGLDIGTTAIRIVWLSRDNDRYTYEASAIAPTPSPGMQSESPFDHQELAKYLNKLVSTAKITTRDVTIALPERQVFTKVIDMPVISEKELANAIYWEAEQYIPAPLNTMTLDWSILRKPKEANTQDRMQVLLVAAPLQLIKRYQTIVELAGFSLVAVETEILSVIRSVIHNDHTVTSLIMHMGALSTSLCIVKEQIMVFNYSVPLGGIAMTRAIAADFGFTPTQAEEYKRTYGISDEHFGGKVGTAIQPILTELLSEARKAMVFYNEKYREESPISQILLTGASANLPGIDLYFAEHIGIETVIANPWKLLDIQKVPTTLQSSGAEYAVALGLALKEYE